MDGLNTTVRSELGGRGLKLNVRTESGGSEWETVPLCVREGLGVVSTDVRAAAECSVQSFVIWRTDPGQVEHQRRYQRWPLQRETPPSLGPLLLNI